MKTITEKDFSAVIKAAKAVIFFHKPGCSNCKTMKPVLENYEKENQDVVVTSYNCLPGDKIIGKFLFKNFPLIAHYSLGKLIGTLSGMLPIEKKTDVHKIIGSPFMEKAKKLEALYDLGIKERDAKKLASVSELKASIIEQSLTYERGEIEQPFDEEGNALIDDFAL